MRMRSGLILASLAVLSGCAQFEKPTVIPYPAHDWRAVVTTSDRDRLKDWRTAFVDALRSARSGGHSADIDREGVLLDPDAALGGGPIPNGIYRCRVIKVGAKQGGMLPYIAYPAFNCRVQQEEELQGFVKLTGSQRQVGDIFPGDQLRQVFLGTLVLGDETRAYQYGRDMQRDVAGFVERISPNRWRLIMPRPHFESQMDVMELVPAS
jgi:hypothetical protein